MTLRLSWMLLTPTIDIFEVIWVAAFAVALRYALFNWWDARLYLEASREGMGGQGLHLLAPKDMRAAQYGVGKASLGLLAGLALMTIPSVAIAGDLSDIFAALWLRLVLIAIGVLIALTARNDTKFRQKLMNERVIRRRGATPRPPATV